MHRYAIPAQIKLIIENAYNDSRNNKIEKNQSFKDHANLLLINVCFCLFLNESL